MLKNKGFIRYIFALALFLAINSVCWASGTGDIAVVEGVIPVNSSQLEEMIQQSGKENIYIFDANLEEVRKESGTIPGAILVDMADTNSIVTLLPKDKKAIIVFYCMNRLCYASSELALQTQNMGYENVYVMLDGIEGWTISGRAVDKSYITRWVNATDMDNFTDYVHEGLIYGTIPACRDCHGSDGIKTISANTKALINENCASCHKKEQETFLKSVHSETTKASMEGALLFDTTKSGEEKKEKPTCWNCHSIHKADDYEKYNRKQITEAKCGKCHEGKQETFRDTFHGKALYLTASDDMPTVSSCYDCHSKHNIQKIDDVDSNLHYFNRVETCAKCHEKSNDNFASYIGHPEPTNKDKNAVLYYVSMFFIILITIVFVFFGVHTILWWFRMYAMRKANPEAWKKAREAAHHDKIAVRRFTLLHRLQHFFMGMSFLTLALTGLPQMCYDAGWAKVLANIFGGPIMLTKIHHVAAVVLFCVFVSHIIEVSRMSWKRRDSIRNPETGKLEFKRFLKAFFGPESLFPRMQDLRDLVAHMKWFLYRGPRPQFDRWTYWEKFDYLAEIWGMFTFGITGLILWFPTTIGSLFPGWVMNLATIIHSYEALLAIGFIFAIHFFNTHFRVDRFPMDMVIFSGTITQEEMVQERKVWYDRMEKSGKLAAIVEENGTFAYSLITKIIGFVMLGSGLLFLVLMVYAFLSQLV